MGEGALSVSVFVGVRARVWFAVMLLALGGRVATQTGALPLAIYFQHRNYGRSSATPLWTLS